MPRFIVKIDYGTEYLAKSAEEAKEMFMACLHDGNMDPETWVEEHLEVTSCA